MFTPIPMTLPPGVVRNGTRYAQKGRWYATNMVRFVNDSPERWGGWEKISEESLGLAARGAIDWRSNDGERWAAFGTANKLWLFHDGLLYDITPVGMPDGVIDSIGGETAWGEFEWGSTGWGGSGDELAGNVAQASTWSLARWGEDLLAVRRGSTLYRWSRVDGPDTPAAPVIGAPATCLGVFVTEERHAVVIGAHDGTADDPVRLQWPSQETLSVWTPDATNSAGDMRLENCNVIMAPLPITGGHLVLTDNTAYTWKYIGGQFVFSKDAVAGSLSIVGPNAGTEFNGDAYWMTREGFAFYNGRARELPSDVREYVFKDINRTQFYKVWCGVTKAYGEIIWFYPSRNSLENDRYVTYKPLSGIWEHGNLERSCWIGENIMTSSPIAVDSQGNIFRQETGDLGDGQPIEYLLESGDVDFRGDNPSRAAAETHVSIRKIVPDFLRLGDGNHTLTLLARTYPQAPPVEKGPYSFNASTKAFSPRARGAYYGVRFSGNGDFRMGQITGYVTPNAGK